MLSGTPNPGSICQSQQQTVQKLCESLGRTGCSLQRHSEPQQLPSLGSQGLGKSSLAFDLTLPKVEARNKHPSSSGTSSVEGSSLVELVHNHGFQHANYQEPSRALRRCLGHSYANAKLGHCYCTIVAKSFISAFPNSGTLETLVISNEKTYEKSAENYASALGTFCLGCEQLNIDFWSIQPGQILPVLEFVHHRFGSSEMVRRTWNALCHIYHIEKHKHTPEFTLAKEYIKRHTKLCKGHFKYSDYWDTTPVMDNLKALTLRIIPTLPKNEQEWVKLTLHNHDLYCDFIDVVTTVSVFLLRVSLIARTYDIWTLNASKFEAPCSKYPDGCL